MCPILKVMIEFVLIAHLHLTDGRLGPDMVIDFYPTHSECRERAENAEDIVAMINQEWYAYMDEEASHGHIVPPIKEIGMYCKPLGEAPGEQI